MFINSIVWYKNQGQHMIRQCMQSHDNILFYGFNHIFNIQREVYVIKGGTYNYHMKKYGKEAAEKRHQLGKEVQDVWSITANTNKNYPTQKPQKLMERIICLSTI